MISLSGQKYFNKTEGPGGGQFAVGYKSYKLDRRLKKRFPEESLRSFIKHIIFGLTQTISVRIFRI